MCASITAFVPEFDDFLKPDQARRVCDCSYIKDCCVEGAKHLWLGEPFVNRALSEINTIVTGRF